MITEQIPEIKGQKVIDIASKSDD